MRGRSRDPMDCPSRMTCRNSEHSLLGLSWGMEYLVVEPGWGFLWNSTSKGGFYRKELLGPREVISPKSRRLLWIKMFPLFIFHLSLSFLLLCWVALSEVWLSFMLIRGKVGRWEWLWNDFPKWHQHPPLQGNTNSEQERPPAPIITGN